MVMVDLESFFEGIDRNLLAKEAAALGFPMQVLRPCLAAYSGPRMVAMHGKVAKEVCPKKGVIAGCAFATVYVKVLMLRALGRAAARLPDGVTLDAYIDDIAIAAVGSKDEVTHKLLEAYRIVKDVMLNELGCRFAEGDTGVVATSLDVARRLRQGVGIGGIVVSAAPNLGVDATAARPRRFLSKGALKHGRLSKALRRGRRLARLRYAIGDKATRIYRAGAEKAATYGAGVCGLSDVDVRNLRKLASTTLRPKGRGRSLALTLLLAGAPTAVAEAVLVLQYHGFVWEGIVNRDKQAMRGISLGCLTRWWDAARKYSE